MSLRLSLFQSVFLTVARLRDGKVGDPVKDRESGERLEKRLRLAKGVAEQWTTVADVRCLQLRKENGAASRGVLLHLHGGGYTAGTALSARIMSKLVALTGVEMVSVDYRRPPEHPYPAAVDDALAVYRALTEQHGAEAIVVLGESAGGGLLLSLLQRVRAEGLPMPAAAVPYFPWCDLTQSAPSYTATPARDILRKATLDLSARLYAGDLDLRDPGLSPINATFDGFPKTLVPVGTRDHFLAECRRLVELMKAAGVDVELLEVPNAIHGFVIVPAPEVRAVQQRVAGFITQALRA